MARLLLILAFAALIFWVFSVVDAAVQPAVRHRGVGKAMWVAIVIVFPVLGGILWFTVGRLSARSMQVQAPDDDPEFLRTLDTHTRGGTRTTQQGRLTQEQQRAQDERIRRFEEELRRLDTDGDDPPADPPRGH